MKRRQLALALVLVLLQGGLLLGIAFDKSETFDEHVYLIRSSRLFESWPAVPRSWLTPQWAFAAALWTTDPSGFEGRRERRPGPVQLSMRPGLTQLTWNHPERWPRLLRTARLATMCVTVAAGLWLWGVARRFGAAAGLAAHVLWVFSPTVLAHGCLVNLDAWAAAWAALLLLCAVRFIERPTWARAAQMGPSLALAASTKGPTVVVAVPLLAFMAWAVLRPSPAARGRARAFLECAAALAVTTLLALFALYGFSFGYLGEPALAPLGLSNTSVGPLPFPVFLEALLTQATYGAEGKTSYLFGEVSKTGWWWFYIAVLAFKVALGAQLLFAARLLGLVRAPLPERRIDLALLAAPCLLLLVLSLARAQGGVRYLLPAFPFALVFLARGLPEAERAWGRRGRAAYLGVLLLGVLESLSVYPHALMFFNVWAGGPQGGPRYLIYSDDWGQDKRRLGEWQKKNGLPMLYYTRHGLSPGLWGVAWEPAPCTPKKGVFALQAEEVHRHGTVQPGCLDWLTLEPPDERLGYSIYLYIVDKERLLRLAGECATPRPFWRSGDGTPCDDFQKKT